MGSETGKKRPPQRKDMTQSEIEKVFETLELSGNVPMLPPTQTRPDDGTRMPYFPVSGSTSPQTPAE